MNRKDRRVAKAINRGRSFDALLRTAQSMHKGKERSGDAMPESKCGHCGHMLDGASHGVGLKSSPGDISVCLYCFGVNTFSEDLQLVKLTEEDVANHECRDVILEHQAMIRSVYSMRGPRGEE